MDKRTKILIYIVVTTCCVAILVAAIVVSILKKAPSYPVIQTDCGKVEGRLFRVTTDSGERQKVYEFLNIPYAAPPTGHLRWRAPVDIKNHSDCSGTLRYNDNIIKCVQILPDVKTVQGQEDCLILNVRTPSKGKDKNLPVLVWIHGGGMMYWHSRVKGYYPDNQFTASMEVVTVSINYRLNIFGFLSLKELWEERQSGGYGNYGIMDQILALRWVKENIRNFGGNPNDVTIFGQSGGGTAMYCLLSASLGMSKGLFHKIIASSGAPNIRTTPEEADLLSREIINKANCSYNNTADRLACLRGLDINTVLSSSAMSDFLLDYEWEFPFNVPTKGMPLQIIDPLVVKYSPSDLLSHLRDLSQEHKLSILMGNMAQEPIHLYRPNISSWSDWKVLQQHLEPRVRSFKNCNYTKLLALYKTKSRGKFMPSEVTPYYIYSLMTADLLLSCATTELAYNLTQYGPFKVYSYIVSQALSPTKKHVFNAEHGFDFIPLFDFVFLKERFSSYKPTKEDIRLKGNLRRIFKDFIYSSKTFENKYRNKTMEFWNSTTVHAWDNPYHEHECKILREHGFLKHSWGNQGVWND